MCLWEWRGVSLPYLHKHSHTDTQTHTHTHKQTDPLALLEQPLEPAELGGELAEVVVVLVRVSRGGPSFLTYTDTDTHTHTHIHTHTHTHTQTQTHTHSQNTDPLALLEQPLEPAELGSELAEVVVVLVRVPGDSRGQGVATAAVAPEHGEPRPPRRRRLLGRPPYCSKYTINFTLTLVQL